MGFWSWLTGAHGGITANSTSSQTPPTVGAGDYTSGDPDGLELEGEETFSRSLPTLSPSPWDGWPDDWATPNWEGGLQRLVDTAWAAIDLNASTLASMPVYQTRSGEIINSETWLTNPDPDLYTSWFEFARQLFWDYQMGEAFVMPRDFFANGHPATFHVVPPWFVNVEMGLGERRYTIGGADVTGDILHIRYHSRTTDARGHGPLEASSARMVTAGVLTRYMSDLAERGGRTSEWISTDRQLTRAQAEDLREQWAKSRRMNPADPAVLSGGAELNQSQYMSARDLALLELSQFTEARIAIMLGVPPFLLGLPSGGDSMTYSNVSSLFDFHHRSSLNPKAAAVMPALSQWALPRGQSIELNRDEYTRPDLFTRSQAYENLWQIGAISAEEVRRMERLHGDAPESAPTVSSALTGGDQ